MGKTLPIKNYRMINMGIVFVLYNKNKAKWRVGI
jgi:hypothetical protein